MPRLEPIWATHATARPVKLKVAVAVDDLENFTDPPEAPVSVACVQLPTYVMPEPVSCLSVGVKVGPAAKPLVLPLPSVARTWKR